MGDRRISPKPRQSIDEQREQQRDDRVLGNQEKEIIHERASRHFRVFVEQLANLAGLFLAEPSLIDQLHDQGRDRVAPQALDERFELLPEDVGLRGRRRKNMHERAAVAVDQSFALQPLQERMHGGKFGLAPSGYTASVMALAVSGPRAHSTFSTANSASVTPTGFLTTTSSFRWIISTVPMIIGKCLWMSRGGGGLME